MHFGGFRGVSDWRGGIKGLLVSWFHFMATHRSYDARFTTMLSRHFFNWVVGRNPVPLVKTPKMTNLVFAGMFIPFLDGYDPTHKVSSHDISELSDGFRTKNPCFWCSYCYIITIMYLWFWCWTQWSMFKDCRNAWWDAAPNLLLFGFWRTERCPNTSLFVLVGTSCTL